MIRSLAVAVLVLPILQISSPCRAVVIDTRDAFLWEDGSVSLAVDAQPMSSTGQLSVAIEGIPSTWGIDPNGGVYTASTETWQITVPVGGSFSGGPILSSPSNSDVDLRDLKVTATETNPSSGQTIDQATTTMDVTVDAVADVPTLVVLGSAGNAGAALPFLISALLTDIDGSESLTNVEVVIPTGAGVLSSGTSLGGGLFSVPIAELAGLTFTPSLSVTGNIGVSVSLISTESAKSDIDFDFTNDSAQAFAIAQFDVAPVTATAVPEPSTLPILSGGLLLLTLLRVGRCGLRRGLT